MRYFFTSLIILTVLAVSAPAEDYFPLRMGNQWTYSYSNGVEMTVKVTGFRNVDEVRCAIVESTAQSDIAVEVTEEYLAAYTDGLRVLMTQAQGQMLRYDPPIQRIKLPFKQGEKWNSTVLKGSVSTKFESLHTEQITTQAGDFDCIVIRSSSNYQPPMVSESYYADGVGLVLQKIQISGREVISSLTSYKVQPTEQFLPAPEVEQLRCPNCNAVVSPDDKYCLECGAEIIFPEPELPQICLECGEELPPDAKFCPKCGAKVEKPQEIPAGPQALIFDRYQTLSKTLRLFKPIDWVVIEGEIARDSYAIYVTEPNKNAAVIFMNFPVSMDVNDYDPNSSAICAKCIDILKQENPDLVLTKVSSTVDKDRTIAEWTIPDEGGKIIGKGYFFFANRMGTAFATLIRENYEAKLLPTVMDIITNISYAPANIQTVIQYGLDFSKEIKYSPEQSLNPAVMIKDAVKATGREMQMVPMTLPDKSLSFNAPKEWTVTVGKDLKFLLVDDPNAPHYGMNSFGYRIVPTEMSVPGIINAPYQPPAQALKIALQLGKLGELTEIIAEFPGEQAGPEIENKIQEMRMQGLEVDSRLLHVKFKSADGTILRGLFSVQCITTTMSNIWQFSVDGSWAPDKEYEQLLPVYMRIIDSFEIDKQWLEANKDDPYYYQRQMNRELQSILAKSDENFEPIMENIEDTYNSWDYTSWMWTQTTLGQGSWIANNEGMFIDQTYKWGIDNPLQDGIDLSVYNITYDTVEKPWAEKKPKLIDTRGEFEKYISEIEQSEEPEPES